MYQYSFFSFFAKSLLFAFVVMGLNCNAFGHFVWVYKDGNEIKIVFGEGLEPDQAQFLDGLKHMKAFQCIDGQRRQIEFGRKTEGDLGWFDVISPEPGATLEIVCPYGIFSRGDSRMFLDYSAKYVNYSENIVGDPSSVLKLDLVPEFEHGKLAVTAWFEGKPLSGAEIQLEGVETDSIVQTTDDGGKVSLQPAARYIIRGKHTVAEEGEVDGEQFSERRYYCTLVVDVESSQTERAIRAETQNNAANGESNSITVLKIEPGLANFPKEMTSFGATVLDNQIFVIGGKSGEAHAYARSYQNRHVYRLNLDGTNDQWQIVGENSGLQGLAIVGFHGKIYRVGGLEARNDEGDDDDLHSTREFLVFDPDKKSWKELPELPEGRSSIDACVAGNYVYVAGGWIMAGPEEPKWATDMLKFDLTNPESAWERIEAPFVTRAAAVRLHEGKIYVVGGIQESGGTTNAVHIFDLESGQWSIGPEVPAEGDMKSFGCSAVSLGGHLLVSTYDGGVYHLSNDAKTWQKVHQLDAGRFFHQMLPVGNTRFALVGGSHMEHGGYLEVEVYEVVPAAVTKTDD